MKIKNLHAKGAEKKEYTEEELSEFVPFVEYLNILNGSIFFIRLSTPIDGWPEKLLEFPSIGLRNKWINVLQMALKLKGK